VERFHRTLKAAIMCHADQNCTKALPLVLLRIRTSFKEDLQASVAELVYGEPLQIPGELLTPTADPVDPALPITELRQRMAPASGRFQQHATPPQPHSCTAISGSARTSSSARTEYAGLWSPLQRPLPGPITEREDFSCAGGPSPC
jgi:hypothetical protein